MKLKLGTALFLTMVLLGSTGIVRDRENFITHGPMLGRPGAHSMGVWARTAYPGIVSVKFGLSADALTRESESTRTHLEDDNTGWVLLKGLKANTQYHYKVILPGITEQTARTGTFRTLPDAADYRQTDFNPDGLFNFAFEFACGNNQNPGQGLGPALPAFATMLREIKDKIHFAILNGDWLYEVRRDYQPDQWIRQVDQPADSMPRIVRLAPAITGIWENYKFMLEQGDNMREWHRHVPSLYTFDDHELLNDVVGTNEPGFRNRRAVIRDIAVRAWYDYLGWSNPETFHQKIVFGQTELKAGSPFLVDPNTDFNAIDLEEATNLHLHWGTRDAGVNDWSLDRDDAGKKNAGVYRILRRVDRHTLEIDPPARADEFNVYSIGRRSYFKMRISNCDFFVLDTRGIRSMHDVRYPDKKGVSMLGKDQCEWLMREVKQSKADFIFIVSSVNFMIPHVSGTGTHEENKDDAWTVFLEEREKLINMWDTLPQPVFVLTGDLHNSFAIRITDNVWEFASGPHNSRNHWAKDEGGRPANGRFKYGPREVDIRWSTLFREDVPRSECLWPVYCVVQVNNVYNNPVKHGAQRWIAYPHPQVIFQYYHGLTGELMYAESILGRQKQGSN